MPSIRAEITSDPLDVARVVAEVTLPECGGIPIWKRDIYADGASWVGAGW